MILVIDGINKHRFGKLLDQMFGLRARVFHDRMGWDVQVTNGRETDLFDDLDPAYLVSLDEDYTVVGCNRMLQTTGPHMLADVFNDILDGDPPLRSATVWENTRFCIDRERLSRTGSAKSVSYTACELMVGILEYGRDSGISDVISVVDPAMDRILKRCDNAPYGYLGKTADMGKVRALAALNDCTDDRIDRVRAFAGIEGDVFLDEDEVAEALSVREAASTQSIDLHDYCEEQIAAATNDHERRAALALRRALEGQFRPEFDCDA
jgi:acyl homoserine lactone synthase